MPESCAPFTLPKLPYDGKGLEPYISAETLSYHHGKHHNAYVTKLNEIVAKEKEHQGKSLQQIIDTSEGVLFNQAGQHYNHSFYWESMAPKSEGHHEPEGELAELIKKKWGSFDDFKTEFNGIAGGHFGSGWAFLCYQPEKNELFIHGFHDAATPVKDTKKFGYPLLTVDVWEHAYYVDYRNARPEYLKNIWNVMNWKFAAERLAMAKEKKCTQY